MSNLLVYSLEKAGCLRIVKQDVDGQILWVPSGCPIFRFYM